MRKILTILAAVTMLTAHAQTGFKALKISTQVISAQNDTMKSGVIIVPTQTVLLTDRIVSDSIYIAVTFVSYKSQSAKDAGKQPYPNGEMFSKTVQLKVPKTLYTSNGFEGNLINEYKAYYEKIYPGNVKVITLN